MKILIILFLVNTFVFANIGKIASMRGTCTVKRGSENLNATLGFVLEEKDILNTQKKSKLQIIFKDGSIVTVGKSSVFNIAEYSFDAKDDSKAKASFGFLKGSFKSITGKIGKIAPDKFKLRTKTATIGIRGTTIVGNQSAVACTQGAITITANGVTHVVPAGMFSKTPQGQAPSAPEKYVPGSISEDVEETSDEPEKKEKKEDKKEKKEERQIKKEQKM